FMFVLAVLAMRERMPTIDPGTIAKDGWRTKSLVQIGPIVVLVATIVGAMYAGFASPTDAAVVGVIGAIAISGYQRCLTVLSLGEAVLAAARTSSMLGLLLAAGAFLSVSMGYIGIPQAVASWIAALDLTPFMLIMMLLLALI